VEPIVLVQPRETCIGWIFIAPLALTYLFVGPIETASMGGITALVAILCCGLVVAWIQFFGGYRKVRIGPAQDHIEVESRSPLLKRRTKTYRLSSFQSVYSYVALTTRTETHYELVLYSLDKRELLLMRYGGVLHGTSLFSGPIDSPEISALRKTIAERCGLKDAGFFGLAAYGVQL
jgi:hypothetical protein